jgi:hypothetical protein
VPLAGDPPRYCAALDPIAFRCGSRKTKHQEKHAKDDGHRQGRYGDEGPTHRLVSLVTDLTQSCGADGGRIRPAPNERNHVTWLWIIIIVILVLALLGFFGRGRFSR